MRKPVAVLTADWHVQSKPPLCRSGEKDWLETQRNYLLQVAKIAGGLPIVNAGDIFDRYNPPPDLINFLIDCMPTVYAVPGNHELPNHRYDDVRRSAYWTLKGAGRLVNLNPGEPYDVSPTVRLWGFPWGVEPTANPDPHDLYVEIAVAHAFVYQKGKGYPGAPEGGRLDRFAGRVQGYDVVVTGDNHQPFSEKIGGTLFVNCGSLMRRTADQRDYRPAVWVLYDDVTAEPAYLDTSKDVFDDSHLDDRQNNSEEVTRLIDTLKGARSEVIDFDEAVRRVIRDDSVKESVRETLRELMQ